MGSSKLAPSVMLLTGAASGIGRHLAGVLVAAGHRVMLADLREADLRALVEAEGWPAERVLVRPLDVRSEEAWQGAIDEVVARFGRLDVLLNVAGYLRPGFLHELDPGEIDRHIDVNLKGVIRGTRVAAVRMVAQGAGHVVNIASLAALAPVPGLNLYSASKFAVRGFSLAVAQELAPHGVAVTTICPDAVATPMLDLQVDYEEAALTFSGPKVLTPADVADAVLEALVKRPMEVWLPRSRASMAMASNLFPELSRVLGPLLAKKGKAAQHRRRTS